MRDGEGEECTGRRFLIGYLTFPSVGEESSQAKESRCDVSIRWCGGEFRLHDVVDNAFGKMPVGADDAVEDVWRESQMGYADAVDALGEGQQANLLPVAGGAVPVDVVVKSSDEESPVKNLAEVDSRAGEVPTYVTNEVDGVEYWRG